MGHVVGWLLTLCAILTIPKIVHLQNFSSFGGPLYRHVIEFIYPLVAVRQRPPDAMGSSAWPGGAEENAGEGETTVKIYEN